MRSVLAPGEEEASDTATPAEGILGAMVASVLHAGGTDAAAITAARDEVVAELGEAALVDVSRSSHPQSVAACGG